MNNFEDKTDDRKKTGGAAFARPISQAPNHEVAWNQEGMTLRDYFAAKAMHEILVQGGWSEYGNLAKEAYAVADAMIKERDKEE